MGDEKENVQISVEEFKLGIDITTIFKKYDKKTWANCGEINLFSDIYLLNNIIVLCIKSFHQPSVIVKYLKGEDILKVEFLDNIEKKGAALIITLRSGDICKEKLTWITTENGEKFNLSNRRIVLTIPIINNDKKSIRRMKKKLSTLCQIKINNVNLKSMNSTTVPLSVIKFSELEKCIKSFKLKAVSYTSNKADGMQFIVIMKNIYSIKRSNTKLKRFLSTMKDSTVSLDDSFYNYFRIIKDDNIFKDYLASRLFGTKNVETNETYDVTGRAFVSLFNEEWLHCDIIDTYLNEWRRRMGEIICNSSKMDKICVKIFNTFLYTRLTRGVRINSLKAVPKKTYICIQNNANKIANEKVYYLSKLCSSIFDFDILIIPIHIDNHWMTGVVYKPRNCLIEVKEDDDNSMEVDSDSHSFIFVFDSLSTNFAVNKHVCTAVLKEYVEACFKSMKGKFLGKDWLFNKDKIKTVKIKDPYRQKNGYDCGLYMLEFIRQIMINPNVLEKLVKGESMAKVFPRFTVTLNRSYLKSFVYSKVDLHKWVILHEMEEYFLSNNNVNKKEDVSRRSKSVEPQVNIENKFVLIKNRGNLKRLARKSYDLEDFINKKRVKLF